MRRPLLGALFAASAALILLFGFSAWLFSRNMGEAERESEERMSGLALYIGEHLRRDVSQVPPADRPYPESRARNVDEWLGRLMRATGLERAVITDSAGFVHASSQILIATGEDIRPYLVDTALFARAARDSHPLFTRLSEIEGVHFQSLYSPFVLQGRRHMVVLESDQNYIAYVEQFRNYMALASLFLIALFALLAAGLFALDRKFQAAVSDSRRNERLAFLGRASAELAHELKNPLGIIKSSVDVLRNQLDPKREHPAFGYLSDEVMRLSRLITNILGFSKDRPLLAKPFRPREALLEAQEAQSREFPEVAWTLDVPPEASLLGDRELFRQVAENLARNAAMAMGGKGRFTVSMEKRGRGCAFLFSDTGPGIPRSVRPRLFEPFASGSKTGTGLGLSIVKNLCERCGWTIKLISDAAVGKSPTCFEVAVPGNG